MKKVLFIFGELNDDDIDWMITVGNIKLVPAETVLIPEGKPIDALYIVLDGQLRVSLSSFEDKEIAILSSGEVVGEMSFVDSRPPSATVTAIEKSRVLAISRWQLAEKLRLDVAFASRFYRSIAVFLSSRLRGTVSQLGYGRIQPLSEEDEAAELNAAVLDNAALAEARFDWLLRRITVS